MARFWGRRSDRTPAIAKAIQQHLLAGESVVAGVDVQTPGTTAAGMQAGAGAAVGSAVGNLPPRFGGGDDAHTAWSAEAEAFGLDTHQANRLVYASLVLTNKRLLVVRRGKAFRTMKDVVFERPVTEIDQIRVPAQTNELFVHGAGKTLTFEIAIEGKFRALVYGELPQLLEQVRAQA